MNLAVSVGFVIMWSSGFIGAKLGTSESSTYPLLMWRFLVAAAILMIVQMLRRALRMPMREAVVHIVVGLLGQGVYLIGTVKAVELGVGAGTVALVAALQPIASSAAAGPVLGERVSGTQWAGLATGLAGVGLVVWGDLAHPHEAPWWAYTLPFAGMGGLVVATLVERRMNVRTSLVQALSVQCMANAVLFTALSFAAGEAALPSSGNFWLAVAWFVVFSTFGGYGFYWLGIRRMNIARMTSLIYLTPPTTMIWAFLMFGEKIAPLAIAGVAICLLAVFLARRPGCEKPKEEPSRMGSVA
ncbi:DMT family transporter [Amycolatopsis sp. NPDC054798]